MLSSTSNVSIMYQYYGQKSLSLGKLKLVAARPDCMCPNIFYFGKWFEPRGISYLFGVIIWVKVVFRKTVVGD